MKILFVTYDLPYPLITGGKVRAYYLIKALAKRHQLTLFSYYRDEEQKKYLTELKKYCQKIFLFKRRPVWSWRNFWLSISKLLPFTSALYWSPRMERLLKKVLSKEHYDFVHFESFYPSLYLSLVKRLGVKAVLSNENVEYQIYQRYSQQRFFAWRWIFELEVLRMRRFEEKLWQKADLNLALSVNDAAVIKKVTKKPCPVIPNGVDIQSFSKIKKDNDGRTLIFVGTLIYQPNDDAMKYFLEKIYPLIKEKVSKVKFVLVSWYEPSWLRAYLNDHSIKFIEDKQTPANEFLRKADIMVAPIRIASGTNIKVLEAMAVGLPVVTTSIGVEGLEVKIGEEIIVADQAIEFAQQVVKLLNSSSRRRQLGQNAQRMVASLYDWAKIGERLNQVYKRLDNEKRS